jgi:curved DNA-binding protein CbpA
MQMMREQAMQYFRRLALLLHPDKNQHPLAKEAFQKLSEAQQQVLNNGHSGYAQC